MAMSNAEKQEAWRQRQRAKLDARFKELEATIARQAAEIAHLQARPSPPPDAELAELKRRVAELERHLSRQQNANGRLSYFHEQLKRDKGLLSKKQDALFLKVLHPDRFSNATADELDKAMTIYTNLRDVLVVKTLEERKAKKQAAKPKGQPKGLR
jgi:hypothetical protein